MRDPDRTPPLLDPVRDPDRTPPLLLAMNLDLRRQRQSLLHGGSSTKVAQFRGRGRGSG